MSISSKELLSLVEGKSIQEEPTEKDIDVLFIGSNLSLLTEELSNVFVITNLEHNKLVEMADDVDIIGICYTNAHQPKPATVSRAGELDILLISTDLAIEQISVSIKAKVSGKVKVLM